MTQLARRAGVVTRRAARLIARDTDHGLSREHVARRRLETVTSPIIARRMASLHFEVALGKRLPASAVMLTGNLDFDGANLRRDVEVLRGRGAVSFEAVDDRRPRREPLRCRPAPVVGWLCRFGPYNRRSDSAELLFGFKGAEMRRFVRTALNCLGGQLTSKLKVAGSNPAGVATACLASFRSIT